MSSIYLTQKEQLDFIRSIEVTKAEVQARAIVQKFEWDYVQKVGAEVARRVGDVEQRIDQEVERRVAVELNKRQQPPPQQITVASPHIDIKMNHAPPPMRKTITTSRDEHGNLKADITEIE